MSQDDSLNLAKPYRDAMSNIASGVHVITTSGASGRFGITVTALASVTDDPPTMVLCVNKKSRIQSILCANRYLCVNVLSSDQQDVAEHFAGMTQLTLEERFEQHIWTKGPSGQLQIHEALAHLHGRIAEQHDMGTHTVFYVRIEHINVAHRDDKALLYFRRAFSASA